MSEKKLAIKLSTLEGIGDAVRSKEGSTEPIPVKALAQRITALPTSSGDNKFTQLVQRTITEVTVDDLKGCTSISASVFNNVTTLERVDIPDTVTSIGQYAFNCCSNLSDVNIRGAVKVISDYAFANCTNLKGIILPDTVTDINTNAFRNSGLTEIVIPDSVTKLASYALGYCQSLVSIEFGAGLTTLDSNFILSNTDNLTSVKLPSRLYQFSGNFLQKPKPYLTQLTFPSTMARISGGTLALGTENNKCTYTFLRYTPPQMVPTNGFDVLYLNKIIVPKGSGDVYKSATNWANYADYIEEATE